MISLFIMYCSLSSGKKGIKKYQLRSCWGFWSMQETPPGSLRRMSETIPLGERGARVILSDDFTFHNGLLAFKWKKGHKKIPAAKLLGFLVDAGNPTGISPTNVGDNPVGRARSESDTL